MLTKYKEWAMDDLKEAIEWIEEIEAKTHTVASLTMTKTRKENENISFTFSAVFEREMPF